MKALLPILCVLMICGSPAKAQSAVTKKFSPGTRVKVIAFLAVDCPISQKYIPLLNSLSAKYQQQHVTVIGIIPGDVKKKLISTFAQEYGIRFNLENDKNYKSVRKLRAEVTPEVFVFDEADVLRYRGAIDNWFYDLGKYRQVATENYLTDAIETCLNNGEIKTRVTEAIGCPIQSSAEVQKMN